MAPTEVAGAHFTEEGWGGRLEAGDPPPLPSRLEQLWPGRSGVGKNSL